MLKFSSVTFSRVKAEIELYLSKTYNKASEVFSQASPYGQILYICEQLFQSSMLYLKNSISQFDMSDVNYTNKKIIRSNAVVAGHNPSRSISASGVLKFSLGGGVEVARDIPGGRITIFNKSLMKNKTNGLNYVMNLGGQDDITFDIVNNSEFIINIIQGKYETVNFTGTGIVNQAYQANVAGFKEVENFNIEVTVNGVNWSIKNHLYEMLSGERACVVNTSFSGGIDIVFGNGSFGKIPELASNIEVSYLVSDGSNGNIYRRTVNDWNIISNVIDGFGTTIDLPEIFDISINTDINFGANGETAEFTRNILPINSNNFVLATPEQYAYWIKRLGVFSYVNAYNMDGVVMIAATPNVKLFKNRNADYFNVDIKAFELDTYEKTKISSYLKSSGVIQLSKVFKITSPTLSYYIVNCFLVIYDDANIEEIRLSIIDLVSEYFLDFNRMKRVPKNDIINLISNINGVDSVSIDFISKKNEDYHKAYTTYQDNLRNDTLITDPSDILSLSVPADYDPTKVVGLDPVLGDILFNDDEYPIIRGGWVDRNEIFYSKDPSSLNSGLSSLNIFKNGTTKRKNNIKM